MHIYANPLLIDAMPREHFAMQHYVYGSSTPGGLGDTDRGTWPNRIQIAFNQEAEEEGWIRQSVVINRAMPGDRMPIIVRKLEQDIDLYADSRADRTVILQPTYDPTIDMVEDYDDTGRAIINLASTKTKTELNLFKETMREFCALALQKRVGFKQLPFAHAIAVVGNTPLAGNSVNFMEKERYSERQRSLFENIARAIVVDEFGGEFLDVWSLCGGWEAQTRGMVSHDRVHPSSKVHERLAPLIKIGFMDPVADKLLREHKATKEIGFVDTTDHDNALGPVEIAGGEKEGRIHTIELPPGVEI